MEKKNKNSQKFQQLHKYPCMIVESLSVYSNYHWQQPIKQLYSSDNDKWEAVQGQLWLYQQSIDIPMDERGGLYWGMAMGNPTIGWTILWGNFFYNFIFIYFGNQEGGKNLELHNNSGFRKLTEKYDCDNRTDVLQYFWPKMCFNIMCLHVYLLMDSFVIRKVECKMAMVTFKYKHVMIAINACVVTS